MNELRPWLEKVKSWYRPQQHSDVDILVNAVSHAPPKKFSAL